MNFYFSFLLEFYWNYIAIRHSNIAKKRKKEIKYLQWCFIDEECLHFAVVFHPVHLLDVNVQVPSHPALLELVEVVPQFRVATKIFEVLEKHSLKSLLWVLNLCQSSTTLGLDPISSRVPKKIPNKRVIIKNVHFSYSWLLIK